MLTTSELFATLAVWALLAIGLFFGLRGVWRRRGEKGSGRQEAHSACQIREIRVHSKENSNRGGPT